jgi:hypothetical protein
MRKYRFNLELPPSTEKQLKDLQRQTEAASVTEVIRKAITLYASLQAHSAEYEIILRHRGKRLEKPVLIL